MHTTPRGSVTQILSWKRTLETKFSRVIFLNLYKGDAHISHNLSIYNSLSGLYWKQNYEKGREWERENSQGSLLTVSPWSSRITAIPMRRIQDLEPFNMHVGSGHEITFIRTELSWTRQAPDGTHFESRASLHIPEALAFPCTKAFCPFPRLHTELPHFLYGSEFPLRFREFALNDGGRIPRLKQNSVLIFRMISASAH